MKFPGRRKSKHYFPITDRGRVSFQDPGAEAVIYVVGIDQLLVDIEARVDLPVLEALGIPKGQSVLLDDDTLERAYQELKRDGRIVGEFAGGSVGNTLHNYSVLADDHSYLLGTITHQITVGDYAFHYVRNTSSRVDLSYLHPVHGPMGRAVCLVTPDGERSFGVARGIMDEFPESSVSEELISGASALLLTAYLLRDEKAPIFKATMRAIEYANRASIPVILSLGTAALVREKRDFLVELFRSCSVGLMAGNFDEVSTLTGKDDPFLAGEAALDFADLVLLTRDHNGLYLCAWTDEEYRRETKDPILSKAIAEYNRFEYSRAMSKRECANPRKIYSHINPYLGGPSIIRNTNGAGDAALAAVLHDIAANVHHRRVAPSSPKHRARFITYSSIHQVCKYANRVSYEVLRRNSPRLSHGLPEREDSLEESYWAA
ncbi:MAG TPA: inosine/guanosine kinase [Myxococcales bacterium]|jgi:inosine kinase|nr:inosine/guanosine kinase [Myxococcales bacterium]